MPPFSRGTESSEDLLPKARAGNEAAFAQLTEPYRRELHAHCYRMLGSLHDTEEAMQEAMLRIWRGLDRFEGRSSLRAWLYRIATNTCLDSIARRKRRLLPEDYAPKADPNLPPGEPVAEGAWIEPYPDEALEIPDGYASPDARYEEREALELAFVVAMQHLSPRQRAALILREVLGFSAKEVGETLETSVPSVNSALQRARETIDRRLPDRSQQATLRALGDARMKEIVEEYMEAMRTGDVQRVVSMLTEDVSWSMPPLASWYGGIDEVEVFLRTKPLCGEWQWRHRAATANGQLAVGTYTWLEAERTHVPFSLDVITLEGDRIKEVTAFVVRPADTTDGYQRWPDRNADPRRVDAVFRRFGLPDHVD
ncbi:MAG TPA: sigma-70 family RNA polymerase sigma factor [Solirubrobacterales bacterium]|nr:sigma-70 family RNA polymerase sigma factor [Solirubrobacterales bacterium]